MPDVYLKSSESRREQKRVMTAVTPWHPHLELPAWEVKVMFKTAVGSLVQCCNVQEGAGHPDFITSNSEV